MTAWHVDEGLATLIAEWKRAHPGAVVGTIGDASHASRDSEHNPEKAGALPGQDAGEVDAGDFMQGNGVTAGDLDELFEGLIRSRDKRILYVIHDRVIVSSVVEPWKRRPYKGSDPHTGHVHLSVNDLFDDNTSDWHWEALVARELTMTTVATKLPEHLQLGDDDDMWSGYNHIARVQALANWLDRSTPAIDTDGVYGPKSAAKFGKALKTSTLKRLTTAQLKQFHGLV